MPIDEHWFCSLNNRRLWVIKQLHERGLLKEGSVHFLISISDELIDTAQ